MNLFGIIAVILSIVAFFGIYRALRHQTPFVRTGATVCFGILSAPAFLFAFYYLHVLPEQAWFYTLRSWAGTEFLVVFLGCAAGAAASLLPRALLGVPLVPFLVLAAAPYIKPVIQPLPDDVYQERWQEEVCLQSTPSTCGPASVSTILRRLGIPSTEQAVAHASFSCASGTEAWYLARYVRRQGCVPHFVFGKTFSPTVGQPALVGVRVGGAGHFIAVLEVSNGQVTFADPLHGVGHLSASDFLRRYQFTGFHMVVTRA